MQKSTAQSSTNQHQFSNLLTVISNVTTIQNITTLQHHIKQHHVLQIFQRFHIVHTQQYAAFSFGQ